MRMVKYKRLVFDLSMLSGRPSIPSPPLHVFVCPRIEFEVAMMSSTTRADDPKGYWGLASDLMAGNDEYAVYKRFSDLSNFDLFIYQAGMVSHRTTKMSDLYPAF